MIKHFYTDYSRSQDYGVFLISLNEFEFFEAFCDLDCMKRHLVRSTSEKGREKRKEEEEDSRTISTTDFPLPLSDERFLKIVSRFAWIGSCIFMNGNRKRGKAILVIHRNIPRNIIYRDTFGDNGG